MTFFKKMDTIQSNPENKIVSGETEKIKCLIIGSGPAGYTAAIYAARANLYPVIYEGIQPGGQLTTTTEVDNFPGYPSGIDGTKLMEDLKNQAARFGTDVRFGIASSVDFSKRPFKVTIDENKIIEAQVVIIATGATAKYLGLESEEKFKGSGVSACATCDGFFYRGQDVVVVGGGDTACEEATYLAGLCKKVYLVVRKNYLRASKAMQTRVFNTPNIEVLFEHQTKEIVGDMGVDGVILTNSKGQEVKINVTGFFVAIGHQPNSDIFKPYIETNEVGYITTIPGTSKTNVPGIFACGDVQDPHYRQAITAAGTGCMAAIDAERFLGENGTVN
jgi:thioredoxin reductase (NADPH)